MKTVKSILHTWKAVWLITLVASAFSMVACQKKDSGRSAGIPVNPYGTAVGIVSPTCQGCMAGGAFLVSTDQQAGAVYLGLDWFGSGTNMLPGQMMYPNQYGTTAYGATVSPDKIALAYTGQVQAGGRLQVSAMDMYLCNIPVGDYNVRTINPGQWQMGVLSGPIRFEAIGITTPVRIVFSLSGGSIYADNGQVGLGSPSRMYGKMMVEQVNNMACMGTATLN